MSLTSIIREENNYRRAIFYVLMSTVVCLAFQIRFVNSFSIFLLVVLVMLHPQRKLLLKRAFTDPYFLSMLALYLLVVAGLLYTADMRAGWKELTKKAGFAAIPFFFCAIRTLPASDMRRLMTGFSLSLAAVSLICLVNAVIRYRNGEGSSVFFYHELVALFVHHAIFFSFFLFYCILYWTAEGFQYTARKRRLPLLVLLLFFLVIILLLSSKLVIGISLVYLIGFSLANLFSRRSKWLLTAFLVFVIVAAVLVAGTRNPVKERFADLIEGNSELFRQERFSPDIYFNGLQFRLLTWRFTAEILNKRHAWLLGVSPGDAQHELNKRYTETGMYIGETDKRRTGFLNFNCHNLYLQTVLETGLLGLLFLLSAIVLFFVKAVRRKKITALIFFTAMLAFGFTESVLSSHYTILLFLFFPLLSLSAEKGGTELRRKAINK
jgi:O-antigen ligase